MKINDFSNYCYAQIIMFK